MKKTLAAALCALALPCATPPGRAQLASSPWPMFRNNLQHTGRSAHAFPSSPAIAWSYQTMGLVYSSPAVGPEGRVYVGAADNVTWSLLDTRLYAFNSPGTLRWSYRAGSGIWSSPAVATDGRVYVGTDDNRLYAVASSGSLAWSFVTGGNVESSPAVGMDGRVYFGCIDNMIYAIEPTGALAWSYAAALYIYCSPAVGTDGRVSIGNHNWVLYSLTPAGGLSWSYRSTQFAMYSSPAVETNGNVYVGDNGLVDPDGLWWSYAHIRAFNSSGAFLWSYRTQQQAFASPAIGSDGRIFEGSWDGTFYVLTSSGALSWSYATGDWISSSAAVGNDGAVCAASGDNNIYAFHPSGALMWTFAMGIPVESSPAIGSDGSLFIGSYDAKVYCFRQAPAPTVTPVATVTPTPTVTPPIDLTANRTEFQTIGRIEVTADVWPLTVPCYPFVRIVMPDGSTLWYQTGVGFSSSPVPYLGFGAGPITLASPISDYPALSANFAGIATGTYVLEGGAVDATQTTSADNLIYWGRVDQEPLVVQ